MKDTHITCLCDNAVKLSSPLRGEHGIAFFIEQGKKSILFDTGQSFEVLSHNAEALGIDLGTVTDIILSHGHYDHTGGLLDAAMESRARILCHPDAFEKKYKRVSGEDIYIGMPWSEEELSLVSDITCSTQPTTVTPTLMATGEVPRQEPLERVPDLFLKESGQGLVHDTIRDDQSLIIDNGEEATVLLGCNHAGMLNTLAYCQSLCKSPISLVAGGTHLVAASPERIEATAAYALTHGIVVHGYHCTGDAASFAMRKEMGEQYGRGYVGMTYHR